MPLEARGEAASFIIKHWLIFYAGLIKVMIDLVKRAGWKTIDINDPKKMLDYCERCKDVDLDSK